MAHRIRPSTKQFWVDNLGLTFCAVLVLSATLFCFIFYPRYALYPSSLFLALMCFGVYRWSYLQSYVWEIRQEEIIQRVGVIAITTDHVEMYRIVDYQETQTFFQRLLGVKTVVLISTDRLNNTLAIKGQPTKSQLMHIIRERVELCKTKKRIYEITNH